MSEPLLLRGGRLLGATEATSLLIAGGRIACIGRGAEEEAGPAVRRVEVDGLRIGPGLIDLQVNGASGRDFTGEPAAIWEVGSELARHGVTTFVPTIISAPPSAIPEALDAWRSPPSGATAPGALPIGLHLEGPFLAPGRRGAHASEHLRIPDLAAIEGWSPQAGVRMVTLAPELPRALEVTRELVRRGVVVGVGHTDATAATARRAFDAGARYVTHTFNAMSGTHHREPGTAAAALLDERATLGLIADGHHVADELLALAWRCAGPERISLVTDAIAALGMPRGRYPLGDREVLVGPDGARLADGTLAGAATPLDACLRSFARATGCGLADAIGTVTSVPARLLGLGDGRGEVRLGGRADLALLDDHGALAATLVAGAVAYAAEPQRWA